MDLDAISSDTSFTFPKFRALCVQHGICQRCGQQFEESHKKVRGCVLPDSQHMDIKQKIELFQKWSATRGQSVSQIDTRHSPHDSNLFSRITSATALPSNPPGPTTSDTASSSTPASRVLLDQIPHSTTALTRQLMRWRSNQTPIVRL
ncbi:hypothetical protein PCASD_04477 [Puccinia coronata f. sp. avenae]|uniref:Uncharacterized protein n=1 Tax=Puccinia coronata f. sp. avenae TaxID=200324 RepID=A0A2N5V306_9BASI|nr:hypothetical protein PCASD_04477 [Puccinia coronata f. sp. avenae]